MIESFDFWYKMANLILCLISSIWISNDSASISSQQPDDDDDNKSYIDNFGLTFIVRTSWFTIFMMIFLSDAILFAVKTRQFFLCGIAVIFLGYTISVFFNVNEDESHLNWNPFSMYSNGIGKYTNINGKSLVLSSITNLVLFSLKPICSNKGKEAKQCLCQAIKCSKEPKDSKDSNKINCNKYLMQSTSVYKKPYFEWKNVDIHLDNDHETKKQEVVSSANSSISQMKLEKQESNIELDGKHTILMATESP